MARVRSVAEAAEPPAPQREQRLSERTTVHRQAQVGDRPTLLVSLAGRARRIAPSRELALRLRRANEELASLEPAVDPEPVAKKLREISEGREGVLEKARYETWHTELKGMEERCWELVRAFRNPPEGS